MLPAYHALAAAAAAVPLARRGWSRAALGGFFAGAVLIDVDHYLGYAWETGDWWLPHAYAYYRAKYRKPRRPWRERRLRPRWPALDFEAGRWFHAAPVLVLVWLLALRWPALRPVALGALFHRVQDEIAGYVE